MFVCAQYLTVLVYRPDCFNLLECLQLSGIQRRSPSPEGAAEPSLADTGFLQGNSKRDKEAEGDSASQSDKRSA
jgi:hypothetical protein